ncbi:MAG: PIG-L family deacetylase [Bryobacterales bacterium]|nr:PIG-L family deacetylase [Bryobacterales bacterium]
MTRHILSIHAHPDDMEILAGGTLALLAEKGHRITVVTMTPGDCGSAEYGAEEIAAMRRLEAAAGAALIGASYECAEFRDLAIFNDDISRRRVVELIRSIRPDLILTSAPSDYHCDHEATSMLVRDACFAVSAPNYRTGVAAALEAIPHLYFMDSVEGTDREGKPVHPEFGVNIEAQFALKREMLAAHASQRNWLMRQHGMDDYLLTMEEWTHQRGQSFGVKYAEGFRQYRHHPYPVSPLLQEMVGGLLLR